MQQRPFRQVDVFSDHAYRGNPLAVVLEASGLTADEMQHFARWTNLSETAFLLPAQSNAADYRVRIFTPGGELPFAGHPTLGSCHAWLEAGGKPRERDSIVQECELGLVRIRRQGSRQAFAAPAVKRSAASPVVLEGIANALGLRASQVLDSQVLDNGPVWVCLWLDSPRAVLGLSPDHAQLKKLGVKVGIAAAYDAQSSMSGEPQVEVRAFAAASGIPEDPVTGSLNASLAQWLIGEGYLPNHYLAAQGACLARAGRIYIECDDSGQVWVGGDSVTCIAGSVHL